MAANLKKLNSDLRSRRKKKPERDVMAEFFDRLITVFENSKQPIVNVEARQPSSYLATIQLNRRGDMISARIDPITE